MQTAPHHQAKPVTLLTGFLGSGKTTFLNELIKAYPEKRPIIVENEFGEENIDAELVIGAGDKIFSFSDGCVCCSLNDELFALLRQLWENREKFDELIIEATGIADPGFIAMPFVENPNMERFYRLDRVICLVDAQFIENELKNTEEARKQIAFSDILLITKTDEVPAGKTEEIKHLLKDINPWASVLSGNKKDGYPIEAVMQLTRDKIDGAVFEQTQEKETEHRPGHHQHGASCTHHSRHHDIESFSFTYTHPFGLEKLQDKLIVYLNAHEDQVYRVKGFVDVAHLPNRLVVQLAGTVLTVTDGQDWKDGELRQSRLVFIGKGLKKEDIDQILQACLQKETAEN